jgi:hypothetical protein
MINLSPGGKATLAGRRAAETSQRLLRDELPRVRAAAVAWRNGLAGLLAGLLGFSLIKGQSDVGRVAPPWNVFVGVLLLAALLAGVSGALRLLWSAHGGPTAVDRRKLGSGLPASHEEAVQAVHALRYGIVLSLLCAALLVTAVAVTWYGPERTGPELLVTTPTSSACGSVVETSDGTLILKTGNADLSIDLRTATAISAVNSCGSR